MMRSIVSSLGLCFCVLFAVAGAGCSGSEVKPIPQRLVKMGYQLGPSVDIVRNYSVEGWHALDDEHVIVETGTATDYLVTLAVDCDGLHAAETIGFSSTTGDLTPADDLIIHQISANFKCPLKSINTLERQLTRKP